MLTVEIAYALAGASIILFPALLCYMAWKAQRQADAQWEAEKCRVTETISMKEWKRRYLDQ